jgi:hypothetical protein
MYNYTTNFSINIVIQDEANQMMAQLGHLTSNETYSYERSILHTLFTCPDSIQRDSKSKRVKILAPRLNIHSNFHPSIMIASLKQQRKWLDDGFFNTFLISAPPAPHIYASEIRQCEEPILTSTCILFFIQVKKLRRMLQTINLKKYLEFFSLKVLHKENINYTFHRKAELLIDNEHNLHTQRITTLDSSDIYFM